MPWPKPRCGLGLRAMSNVIGSLEGELVAVGRALPEHAPCRPARSSCPRELGRRASPCGASTATAWSSAGSPRSRCGSSVAGRRRAARRAGRAARSGRAAPPAIALRVVSDPAANSRREERVQLVVGERRRVDVGERGVHHRPTACRRSAAPASRRSARGRTRTCAAGRRSASRRARAPRRRAEVEAGLDRARTARGGRPPARRGGCRSSASAARRRRR